MNTTISYVGGLIIEAERLDISSNPVLDLIKSVAESLKSISEGDGPNGAFVWASAQDEVLLYGGGLPCTQAIGIGDDPDSVIVAGLELEELALLDPAYSRCDVDAMLRRACDCDIRGARVRITQQGSHMAALLKFRAKH